MSYKNIKINTTQKPDSSDNITLSLSNMLDIDAGSASINQVLYYNGSTWLPTVLSSNYAASDYGFAASNKNTGTGGGNYTDDPNDGSNQRYGLITDTRNSGYGIEVIGGGVDFRTEWGNGTVLNSRRYGRIDIPANGKYLLIASVKGVWGDSSSSAILCWCDSSYNKIGNQVYSDADGRGSKKIYGFIETGESAEIVHIGIFSISGTFTTKSTTDSQTWQIIKVG